VLREPVDTLCWLDCGSTEVLTTKSVLFFFHSADLGLIQRHGPVFVLEVGGEAGVRMGRPDSDAP
jgi:hypothetical protein